MSEFTYEKGDIKTKLERYEWDNLWIEYANEPERKRVLYIGDSISCVARREATKVNKEEILFDGFGTSKGLDNPYFKESILLFAKQEVQRSAILLNNGLHGFHLSDEDEYAYHYEEMVKFLLNEFKNTPLYILLTTHIIGERDARVVARNNVAKCIAEKYNLPIIDLYTPTNDDSLISEDGVHLTNEGYLKIAEVIVEKIKG